MSASRRFIRIMMVLSGIGSVVSVYGADLSGTWTKTTHPDPNNITLFYVEQNTVKAIGYGQIQGKKAFWHGEGEIRERQVTISYHYSSQGLPAGWEQDGTLALTLSEDGDAMQGTAAGRSGWAGIVELRRIQVLFSDLKVARKQAR